MKLPLILLFAAGAGIAAPAAAADSAYDVFIVACDRSACTRIAEQKLFAGLTHIAQYNRSGFKLMMETLSRRTNEEDTRVSLDVRASDDAAGGRPLPVSLAQRLETFVVTLKQQTFSPLTSFVSEGTTYQVWARLSAMR